MIVRPIACVLVPFLLACGVPARPGAEGTGSYDAPVDESAPFSRGASVRIRCTPGERRACRIYWTDILGGRHCIDSTRHCRVDGRAWLPCGRPPEDAAVAAATEDLDDEEDEEAMDVEGLIVR